MASKMSSNVERAGRYYAEGIRGRQSDTQALAYARTFVTGHGAKGGAGIHLFTDAEIRAGKCDCAGCKP